MSACWSWLAFFAGIAASWLLSAALVALIFWASLRRPRFDRAEDTAIKTFRARHRVRPGDPFFL